MAQRIIERGVPTTLWARREEALGPFLGAATLRPIPSSSAAQSDVVGICVTDGAAVREVTLGPAGVLAGMATGSVLALHSTIGTEDCVEIAEAAAERGVEVIDAPVSGGGAVAAAGRLTVYVGGSDAAVARARPVLETYGNPVLHLGALGAGLRTKLVNNALNAAHFAARARRDGDRQSTRSRPRPARYGAQERQWPELRVSRCSSVSVPSRPSPSSPISWARSWRRTSRSSRMRRSRRRSVRRAARGGRPVPFAPRPPRPADREVGRREPDEHSRRSPASVWTCVRGIARRSRRSMPGSSGSANGSTPSSATAARGRRCRAPRSRTADYPRRRGNGTLRPRRTGSKRTEDEARRLSSSSMPSAFTDLVLERRTALGLAVGGRVAGDGESNELFCRVGPRAALRHRRARDLPSRRRRAAGRDGSRLDLDQRFRLGRRPRRRRALPRGRGVHPARERVHRRRDGGGRCRPLTRAMRARPDDGTSWWAATRTPASATRAASWISRPKSRVSPRADGRSALSRDRRALDDGHDPGIRSASTSTRSRPKVSSKRVGSVEGLACLPWHKDCERGGHSMFCSGLTIGICVTPVDEAHGGLDVIAGSHRAHIAARRSTGRSTCRR